MLLRKIPQWETYACTCKSGLACNYCVWINLPCDYISTSIIQTSVIWTWTVWLAVLLEFLTTSVCSIRVVDHNFVHKWMSFTYLTYLNTFVIQVAQNCLDKVLLYMICSFGICDIIMFTCLRLLNDVLLFLTFYSCY